MAILHSIIVTGYNRLKVCTSLPNNNHSIADFVHTAISIDSNRNFTTDKRNLDFRFNLKIKGCIRLHHQIVTFYQYPGCFTMAIHKCVLDSQMELHIDMLSILELFLQWVIIRQLEFLVLSNQERILPRNHHQRDLSS